MRITCPACKLSRDIPESRIPANAKFVTCPRCGSKFDFNRDDYDEPAPAAASQSGGPYPNPSCTPAAGAVEPSERTQQKREQRGEGVPWESDTGHSMLLAFFKTIGGGAFQAGQNVFLHGALRQAVLSHQFRRHHRDNRSTFQRPESFSSPSPNISLPSFPTWDHTGTRRWCSAGRPC